MSLNKLTPALAPQNRVSGFSHTSAQPPERHNVHTSINAKFELQQTPAAAENVIAVASALLLQFAASCRNWCKPYRCKMGAQEARAASCQIITNAKLLSSVSPLDTTQHTQRNTPAQRLQLNSTCLSPACGLCSCVPVHADCVPVTPARTVVRVPLAASHPAQGTRAVACNY